MCTSGGEVCIPRVEDGGEGGGGMYMTGGRWWVEGRTVQLGVGWVVKAQITEGCTAPWRNTIRTNTIKRSLSLRDVWFNSPAVRSQWAVAATGQGGHNTGRKR